MSAEKEVKEEFIKLKSKKGSYFIGGDIRDEQLGIATYKNAKSFIYQGQFSKKKFDGIGKLNLLSKNGDYYLGHFSDGIVDKFGKFRNNGIEMIAEFANGEMNGVGYFSDYKNNLHYGEFKRGFHHGFGIICSEDSAMKVRGWFKNGKKEGHFIEEIKKDGLNLTVTGSYKKNKKHGVFEIRKSDLELPIFRGHFTNNQKTGFAQVNHFRGKSLVQVYEGMLKNGKKNGIGKLTSHIDDYSYCGEFRDNDFFGLGTLKKKRYSYHGNFYKGRKNGIGYQVYPSKDYYFGQWKFGKVEGMGYMKKNKELYMGSFKNGMRHGLGMIQVKGHTTVHARFERGDVKELLDEESCRQSLERKCKILDFELFMKRFENDISTIASKLKHSTADLSSDSYSVVREIKESTIDLNTRVDKLKEKYYEMEKRFITMKVHLDFMIRKSRTDELFYDLDNFERKNILKMNEAFNNQEEWQSKGQVYDHKKVFYESRKPEETIPNKNSFKKKYNRVNKCSANNLLAYPDGYQSIKQDSIGQMAIELQPRYDSKDLENLTNLCPKKKISTGILSIADGQNDPVKFSFNLICPISFSNLKKAAKFSLEYEQAEEERTAKKKNMGMNDDVSSYPSMDDSGMVTKGGRGLDRSIFAQSFDRSERHNSQGYSYKSNTDYDEHHSPMQEDFIRRSYGILDSLKGQIKELEEKNKIAQMELELKKVKLKNQRLEEMVKERGTQEMSSSSRRLRQLGMEISRNSSMFEVEALRKSEPNLELSPRPSPILSKYQKLGQKIEPSGAEGDRLTRNELSFSELKRTQTGLKDFEPSMNGSKIKIEEVKEQDFGEAFAMLRGNQKLALESTISKVEHSREESQPTFEKLKLDLSRIGKRGEKEKKSSRTIAEVPHDRTNELSRRSSNLENIGRVKLSRAMQKMREMEQRLDSFGEKPPKTSKVQKLNLSVQNDETNITMDPEKSQNKIQTNNIDQTKEEAQEDQKDIEAELSAKQMSNHPINPISVQREPSVGQSKDHSLSPLTTQREPSMEQRTERSLSPLTTQRDHSLGQKTDRTDRSVSPISVTTEDDLKSIHEQAERDKQVKEKLLNEQLEQLDEELKKLESQNVELEMKRRELEMEQMNIELDEHDALKQEQKLDSLKEEYGSEVESYQTLGLSNVDPDELRSELLKGKEKAGKLINQLEKKEKEILEKAAVSNSESKYSKEVQEIEKLKGQVEIGKLIVSELEKIKFKMEADIGNFVSSSSSMKKSKRNAGSNKVAPIKI